MRRSTTTGNFLFSKSKYRKNRQPFFAGANLLGFFNANEYFGFDAEFFGREMEGIPARRARPRPNRVHR